jgi:hypothetical protein
MSSQAQIAEAVIDECTLGASDRARRSKSHE